MALSACGSNAAVPPTAGPSVAITTAATVTRPAERIDTTLPAPPAVLVFTRTAGFRHDVLGAPGQFDGPAEMAIRSLAADGSAAVEFADEPAAFTDANLGRFDAVVFLNTTGDVLDPAGEAAFERFVEAGGGFAGVHAAADAEYDWPWYGELVGAYFSTHPAPAEAVVLVEDSVHPSTAHLPAPWRRTDEWYTFRSNPRDRVHVLAILDETSVDLGAGAMGDHPIVWCHHVGEGRAWYTALGHTAESYTDRAFLDHLWGGIMWAAGAAPGAC